VAAFHPGYDTYQARTPRTIIVVELLPDHA
jgi:hypothetical protein